MFEGGKVLMASLIIVTDSNNIRYANYLMQLIGNGADPDFPDVDAAIWSEKQYTDSLPTIPSNQHVMFIGENKLVNSQKGTIKCQYSKYGMNFGYLGKRAVLYVDHGLSNKEYDSFLKYTGKYDERINRVSMKIPLYSLNNFKIDFNSFRGLPAKYNKIIGFGALVPIFILISDFYKNTIRTKKEQQYECLIKVCYTDYLYDFLCIKKESKGSESKC